MVAAAKLDSSVSVYTWDGFCDAAKAMKEVGLGLFDGIAGDEHRTAQAAANVASLLAQCMWESGGEAPFSACDENNYLGIESAPCTQRHDGQRYDTLVSPPACTVDRNMRMTAETWASWTPGPMKCEPGTVTEGCCWWGRGAIQTTGPHNYAMLQQNVLAKLPQFQSIDLCTNPEAMCQEPALKWMGALYYWASIVQKSAPFQDSLKRYVDSGFSESASTVSGATFNDGTGGMVNNGYWASMPHGSTGRRQYFNAIMDALRSAGLQGGDGAVSPTPTPSPSPSPAGGCGCSAPENCHNSAWAVPCFQAGSKSECESYGASATWCDGTTDSASGSTSGSTSTSPCDCSAPNNCHNADWAVPCFQTASEAECTSYGANAKWCR